MNSAFELVGICNRSMMSPMHTSFCTNSNNNFKGLWKCAIRNIELCTEDALPRANFRQPFRGFVFILPHCSYGQGKRMLNIHTCIHTCVYVWIYMRTRKNSLFNWWNGLSVSLFLTTGLHWHVYVLVCMIYTYIIHTG